MNKQFIVCSILIFLQVISFVNAQKTNSSSQQDLKFKNNLSPVNQVFQWEIKEDSNQTAYLWIPENCKHVRGLLILGWNVPEHKIVGHSAIRKACTENSLGIMVSTDFFHLHSDKAKLACLQRQLKMLADTSGYPEIATTPLLPIGESAHLKMVCLLLDSIPLRCIAGACIKDARIPSTILGKQVPMLYAIGTGYEWNQTSPTNDPRTFWNTDRLTHFRSCTSGSKAASVLEEAGTGHFECSEKMTQYIGTYIGLAAKARIPSDNSQTLLPIDLNKGYLSDIPLQGVSDFSISPYKQATPAQQSTMAWFFDAASAKEAQAIAHVNWNAKTQIPFVYAGENDTIQPWTKSSVTNIKVVTNGEFSLHPYLLDSIPSAFTMPGVAGSVLAKSPNKPYVDWICGNMEPLGNDSFRVIGSRYTGLSVLMVKVDSSKGIRYSNQPFLVNLEKNTKGNPQTISFTPIANQQASTKSIPLMATSDKGLPISFYVEAGPAVVKDNLLYFTKIPPHAKFPIAVKVVAWQWGTCSAQLYKQAIEKQIFYITK